MHGHAHQWDNTIKRSHVVFLLAWIVSELPRVLDSEYVNVLSV